MAFFSNVMQATAKRANDRNDTCLRLNWMGMGDLRTKWR
jgi:hypothetical protein